MKRIISVLLSLFFLLGMVFPVLPSYAAETVEDAMEEAEIYCSGDRLYCLLYDGDVKSTVPAYYMGKSATGTPKELPAYCIEPEKPGPIVVGTYTVDTGEYITNPKIYGIITNGFPSKTADELGVASDPQAYYATKMALWTYLNDWDVGLWTAATGEEATLTALKKIYAEGMKMDTITPPTLQAEPDSPELQFDALDSAYLSQTYSVTANTQIKSYKPRLSGNVPTGTKITDTSNANKAKFDAGEQFKVLVPVNQIAGQSGTFDVKVEGEIKTSSVLYGVSYDADTQDFAVCLDPYSLESTVAGVAYSSFDTYIEILKRGEGTLKPLPGAVFRVTHSEDGVVGTFSTDGNGRVMVPLTKVGAYQIEELTPPGGYVLGDIPHQDVIVDWAQTTTVTFTNKKKPELNLQKVDLETGEKLPGAVYRVAFEGGADFVDVQTDSAGVAHLKEMKPGVYTVTELAAPEGYVLNTEPQMVTLEPDKIATVILKNKKKPGLVIRKYDEDSGILLPGAEFSVAKMGGQIVYEGITDQEGTIRLEGLDEGWYTITELAPPKGYLIAAASKNVFLEADKAVEVKFDNRLRPALRITKVDTLTGKSIPGTVFRVAKTDGTTVSEYVTDENGSILIHDLDEAVYTVTEISPAEGYILEGQHKDIRLEWGDIKHLLFDNIRKPNLIVTKRDALTFAPIPNAYFMIEYENADGGTYSHGTHRTDDNGQILLTGVEPGWYTITEVMAAPGYSLPTNPVTRKYLAPGENAYVSAVAPTGMGGDISGTDIQVLSGSEVDIIDYPLNSIVIRKVDANTGKLLAGAAFTVRQVTGDISGSSGTLIGRYTTDSSGTIVIAGLQPGGYIVEEEEAPPNYLLNENAQQQVWLKPDGTSIVECTFANFPYGGVLIAKTDAQTGKPLPNARFRVTDSTGAVAGNSNGEFITGTNGEVLIPNLAPGAYVVTEIEAPEHYIIDTTPQTVHVGLDGGIYKVSFKNKPLGGLTIIKLDSVTRQPLAGVEFKITDSTGAVVGNTNGIFTTDQNGQIILPNLPKGSYIVQETKAPNGYILETQQKTIALDYGNSYTLEFFNKPLTSISITKRDEVTGTVLFGAVFSVRKMDGTLIGEYTTDSGGIARTSVLEPGWYAVREIKAPNGYILDTAEKTVEVKAGIPADVTFTNKAMSGLQIIKIDSNTKQPIKGAKFTVYRMDGSVLGQYETNGDGVIILDSLEPGWYKAVESVAPVGYILDDSPQDFQVTNNQFIKLVFENKPLTSISITKRDEVTGTVLFGAVFSVRKMDGTLIGEYTTDSGGIARTSVLEPGWYTVREIKAPSGYILDTAEKTVEVKAGIPADVTFTNKPLGGLTILKLDSVTRQPLAGVEFTISRMSGEQVSNSFNEATFKTDQYGKITVPGLMDGYYIVTETRTAEGYILDAKPKTVRIQSGTPTLLEVLNVPLSGLLIVKTDANTGKPLKGVTFEVRKANGQQVGIFKTDKNGRILVTDIAAGKYTVTETAALKGYELDSKVYDVTVAAGQQVTLEVTNKPLAGLRLLKIDSVTKQPIYNVEFMVFDSNNRVVGTYYTDNNGLIDFAGILTEGRYTIRETRPAAGYYNDDMPRTVEFAAGKVTEIRWENVPKMGQIQITKKSADANQINGLPKGSLLSGAVFEAYDYKTGNLVDRFTSGTDGRAISKPLPLGRYIVKEVQAPKWYKLSSKTLDITLEFGTQIVKKTFTNTSVKTGVSIKKTGNVEAMSGDVISYTVTTVKNTSNVPLTDFYWRDTLPTKAVRLTKLVTGTYNQSLQYKVTATTNKGRTKVIADNLSTKKNNVIDCSKASLGLKSGEYVTSVTFVFGTVKAGFKQTKSPQIFVEVQSGLSNGYQFANKCDVGGKYNGSWIRSNSTWLTQIYKKAGDLPRTGY